MRYVRPVGIFLYRFFEILFLIVASWLTLAFLLPEIRLNSDYTKPAGGIEIFIRSNGVHTDFILPVRSEHVNWDTLFPRENFGADSGFRFIAFGWGDKGFFLNTPTWGDLTFSTAFVAASGIGESAVHVDYVQSYPKISPRVTQFVVNEVQYVKLIDYIRSTLQFRNQDPVYIDHAGYGKHDLFFEANGRYSLFMTCNEWTGDGMEAAGLPVGIWTPLEFAIMRNGYPD